MNNLTDIQNCTIAIIGLGYVGLPLSIEFAKCRYSYKDQRVLNRRIIGFDINQERISDLRKGIDKTNEVSKKEILGLKNIIFTSQESEISSASIFIVTVPTPIDDARSPDLTILKKACQTIGNAMKIRLENKTDFNSHSIPIVIFESTVYPGATEEVCIPIIERVSGLTLYSGLSIDTCFACGYSPERVNPGDKKHRISSITKVTSGNNKEVANLVDSLYASIIKAGTYNAQSIKVAEAAKVIENTQRDINIALINELSIVFNHLDIDTLDVLKAAETKWNFLPFKPGLVGGHCIGVDPYYLTYKSEKSGYHPEVILAGRRINDRIGSWHVERLILEMVKKEISIFKTNALILGFTFKENCPDIRNTKVIDIVNELDKYKIDTTIIDPLANIEDAKLEYGVEIENKIPQNKRYSIIIVAVAHNKFLELSTEDWESMCSERSIILDIKGIVPRELRAKRP